MKIGFLRANGLGDLVFAWPALNALRKTFPAAEIVYLGKEWHKELFAGRNKIVNRVLALPPIAGVGMPENYQNNKAEIEKFKQQANKEEFDLLFQAHGGGRFSNPFVGSLGAKQTIGLQAPEAAPLDINLPYKLYENEYLRYLELVSLVGAKIDNLMPLWEMIETDRKEAGEALGEDRRQIVALHPGATDPRRRWPAENFSYLAAALAAKKYRVIVTGTQKENELANKIEVGENWCGKLSIGGLAGLLERAELLISNDTGPLHLANVVGTKTIGIFWVGNIINAAPPYKKNHVGLFSWRTACPKCGTDITKEQCSHLDSFVADVSEEEALEAAKELLRRKPAEQK